MLKVLLSFLSVFSLMSAEALPAADGGGCERAQPRKLVVRISSPIVLRIQAEDFCDHLHHITEADGPTTIKTTSTMLSDLIASTKNMVFYSGVLDEIVCDILRANGADDSLLTPRHWSIYSDGDFVREEKRLIVEVDGGYKILGKSFGKIGRGETLFDVQGYRLVRPGDQDIGRESDALEGSESCAYRWTFDPSLVKPQRKPQYSIRF